MMTFVIVGAAVVDGATPTHRGFAIPGNPSKPGKPWGTRGERFNVPHVLSRTPGIRVQDAGVRCAIFSDIQ